MVILQALFHLVSLLCKPDGCRARPVSRHWQEEHTCQVARCSTHSIWKPAPRGSCLQFLGIILQGAEEIMKLSNLLLFFSPPTASNCEGGSSLLILGSQLIAFFLMVMGYMVSSELAEVMPSWKRCCYLHPIC